jgi:peptide deformylase
MAVRSILRYPDPRLRQKALPVERVTPEIERLIEDMAETMYAAPGVGLAATQVGEAHRIFVIDIAGEDEPSDLRVFINPQITRTEGEQVGNEGCLSFPNITEEVKRSAKIVVRALDRAGQPFELEAEGLLAVAVQHESDHLDGVLMIDRMGLLKKRMIHRKMQKRATETV